MRQTTIPGSYEPDPVTEPVEVLAPPRPKLGRPKGSKTRNRRAPAAARGAVPTTSAPAAPVPKRARAAGEEIDPGVRDHQFESTIDGTLRWQHDLFPWHEKTAEQMATYDAKDHAYGQPALITIKRRDADGTTYEIPRKFAPNEIDTERLFELFGGGDYYAMAWARPSTPDGSRRLSISTRGRWFHIPGPSKPIVLSPGAPDAPPPVSTLPTPASLEAIDDPDEEEEEEEDEDERPEPIGLRMRRLELEAEERRAEREERQRRDEEEREERREARRRREEEEREEREERRRQWQEERDRRHRQWEDEREQRLARMMPTHAPPPEDPIMTAVKAKLVEKVAEQLGGGESGGALAGIVKTVIEQAGQVAGPLLERVLAAQEEEEPEEEQTPPAPPSPPAPPQVAAPAGAPTSGAAAPARPVAS